jgi:hypothetical protein
MLSYLPDNTLWTKAGHTYPVMFLFPQWVEPENTPPKSQEFCPGYRVSFDFNFRLQLSRKCSFLKKKK